MMITVNTTKERYPLGLTLLHNMCLVTPQNKGSSYVLTYSYEQYQNEILCQIVRQTKDEFLCAFAKLRKATISF